MLAIRKAKTEDSNVWFSATKDAGILIQPQFRKLTYFIKGEQIDQLWYERETPMKDIDRWVEAKRKHFLNLNK